MHSATIFVGQVKVGGALSAGDVAMVNASKPINKATEVFIGLGIVCGFGRRFSAHRRTDASGPNSLNDEVMKRLYEDFPSLIFRTNSHTLSNYKPFPLSNGN